MNTKLLETWRGFK